MSGIYGEEYGETIIPGELGSTALTQSQDNSGNTGSLGNAETGNGAFLGEGVRSGIDSWDKAYTNAGGTLPSRFGLNDLKQFVTDNKAWLAGAGALASVYGGGTNADKKTGYQGAIPKLSASRSMITAPPTRAQGYRPGAGGIDYGGDVTYALAPGQDPWSNLSGTSGSASGANLGGTTVTPGGTKTTTVTGGGGNDTVVGGGGNDTVKKDTRSDAMRYAETSGLGAQQYLNNINQWILDHPYASRDQIVAEMKRLGVSDLDLQTALGMSNFSDATKYGLTHGMGLQEINFNIDDWIRAHPYATNAQIQAEQSKYGVSDQDVARALTALNSSAGKEYAIVHDMGLDKLYKNILDFQRAGHTEQEIADAMRQYGISNADVKAAQDYAKATGYAAGGMAKGRYLQGETDGMADELPAQIGNNQPAALSHGEFVIPADVVSHMGNGNSDAGAKKLYQMMDKIRMARTGTKKQGKRINPDRFMPGGLAQAYANGGKVRKFEEGGETTEQWAARQPDLSNVADAMERKNALESWQKQRPGYVDPTDFTDYGSYAGAAGIQSGKDAGNDLQNRANFYGMTIENYQNALSGDQTKPMGQFQQVYGNQLLSPIEQIAAQTARGQGFGEPSPYAMELIKKNPEVFNAASQRFHDYMAKTYPGTLEYEGVLQGPSVYDRTGMKKSANGGLMKLAKGGKVKKYAGETGSLVTADKNYSQGISGVESNLSNWAGPYVTNMLGQGQALANMPYQAYMGPLTAGESPLQTQAFNTAGSLTTPASIGTAATTAGNIASKAQDLSYKPTTSSFDATQAASYMNPYLESALKPQLEEARRQSQITQQQNASQMTKAGAFGGGRQAILDAETQRALGANLANITGTGYNTAFDKAMAQFNADQARKAQESQFGATFGLQGLQTGLQGAQAQGSLGLQENQAGLANLQQQLAAGQQQRGIESEGIAADKAQFEEARANPYKMVQYQQSLLQGLPLAAQSYQGIEPSALLKASQGATTVNALLKNLGLI